MLAEFLFDNWMDSNGNPSGGVCSGTGFTISWQHGPLGRGEFRCAPNGAFVETVLKAVQTRLAFYQTTKFACDYNQKAIEYIEKALEVLHSRTADREQRKVEGTHQE